MKAGHVTGKVSTVGVGTRMTAACTSRGDGNMRRKHWNVKRNETNARPRVKRAYNRMKLRALTTLENRGWLSPPAWAVLAGYYPVRTAYTYLKRLWNWK